MKQQKGLDCDWRHADVFPYSIANLPVKKLEVKKFEVNKEKSW